MKESFSKENQSPTPFRESLIESELSPSLKKLKGHPEFVIRREVLDGLKWRFKTDNAHEAVQKGTGLFDELRDRYNIMVVPMRTVYGADEMGQDMVYIITDKIHGKSLNKLRGFDHYEKKKGEEELSDLYSSLIQYLGDVYKEGGIYLRDIFRNVQYVYGDVPKDKEKKLYLADVDLDANEYNASIRGDDHNSEFYYCLEDLAEMIVSQENNMSRARLVRFPDARSYFLDFLNSITPNDPYFSRIEKIKTILNSN